MCRRASLLEGRYYNILRVVIDDGTIVIARIPDPNARPASKTTASEITVIDICKSVCFSEILSGLS